MFNGLPELEEILKICENTKFEDAPDYDRIGKLFDDLAMANCETYTPMYYEWSDDYPQFVDKVMKDGYSMRHVVRDMFKK